MSDPDWLPNEVYGDPDAGRERTFTDGGIIRHHVARRPLSCLDCPSGRGIRPGESYTVFVGLDEDRRFFCERYCDARPDPCPAYRARDERQATATRIPYDDPDNLPF